MAKKTTSTTSSDVATANNNEATNGGIIEPVKLEGNSTNEAPKVEAPKADAIQTANKKAFDSIQGIGLDTLDKVFVVLFVAFQERMAALKALLGTEFDESAFWDNQEIAASIINGACMEQEGFKNDGSPKYVKNQLNAKCAALATPFIVGLGIRKTEDLNALLATRKDNSLAQLARDAYSYSKVISIIPALAKCGLLVNTDRAKVYVFARNEFKNETNADFALKHVMEFAKADCNVDAMKENRISIEQVKLIQAAIKAYNVAAKDAKAEKKAEPAKLSWETVFTPAKAPEVPDVPVVAPLANAASAGASQPLALAS